jgi:DNA modification methylase
MGKKRIIRRGPLNQVRPFDISNMTTLLTGESLRILRTLPSESVHCCVTSPPYWGLRDYQTGKWKGGDARCRHNQARRGHADEKQETSAGTSRDSFAGMNHCRKCGAVRADQQLGLERTPEDYVARMVEIFREVRRVLRDDGTLWLNLGDSYAHTQKGARGGSAKQRRNKGSHFNEILKQPLCAGLKPKDLVGIPWRVAFALQADGWYLRSDIIWHKPNPMPESVKDRPTKCHEYLFLLSKSSAYYYDAAAIAEPCVDGEYFHGGYDKPGILRRTAARNGRHSGNKERRIADGLSRSRLNSHLGSGVPWEDTGKGRNRRTVWNIATKSFKGAHFATFPPKLIEPCILAGAPEGGTVLDCFSGAGTALLVAQQFGRHGIGIDLNREYVKMARQRLAVGAIQKAAA